MTSLAKLQNRMMACLVEESTPLSGHWSEQQQAGLAVYRNNYRAATLEALSNVYERTARLVGEATFTRAAIHYLVTHPPYSWSLDRLGEGFFSICEALFKNDPEVAELARLEWTMHCVFTSQDCEPMQAVNFANATTGFTEDEWCEMRLRFTSELTVHTCAYDLISLWQDTADDQTTPVSHKLSEPHAVMIWREAERPVFRLVSSYETTALQAMMAGASYGDACELVIDILGEDEAASAAGNMLGRWITDGVVLGIEEG